MLDGLELELSTLADHPHVAEVDESGSTFAENAVLKAAGYAEVTGTFTLADDSGLEIAALGGRPGVLSARYGGEGMSFAEKTELVLGEIARTGNRDRRARFVCETAIADPSGAILFTARGECCGVIAAEPRGDGGFGYDPVFIPEGYKETFGELSPAVKHQISHRARAFAQIIPFLRDNMGI